MKIRRLEDRRKSDKPDRSNATWKNRGLPKTAEEGSAQEEAQKLQEKLNEQRRAQSGTPTTKGRRSGRRSRRNGWTDSSERVERTAPKWVIALLLLIPLIVVGYLVLASKARKPEELSNSAQENPITLEEEFANLELGPDETGGFPIEFAETFLNTSDPQERLKYVRDPEKVAQLFPSFPEEALSGIPNRTEVVVSFSSIGTSIHRIDAFFDNGGARSLYILDTNEGLKVDWESYARHSNALQEWGQNSGTSERKEESVVARVKIGIENYYNFRFSDDEDWMSYRLESPDLDDSFTAYAKKGSTTSKFLEWFVASQERRITLQLRCRSEDARNKQYEVEKVIAMGWVITKDDLEDFWLRNFSE